MSDYGHRCRGCKKNVTPIQAIWGDMCNACRKASYEALLASKMVERPLGQEKV